MVRERNELMKRVREGSLADRAIKTCNWIDNTKAGNTLACLVMGAAFVALFAYGLTCMLPRM